MLAAKTKAKLKPMKTAVNAIKSMNAFASGVSKALIINEPSEEERELENAF